jgi:GntR family transcriptional regulator
MIQKSLPLSQQVANEILCGIEANDLAREGGLLPSEAELSQRYSVSRSTVREALSRLEQKGLIIRQHGVGTFVAPPQRPIEAGLERLESIETLARRMGLATQMGALTIEERFPTSNEAEQLQIASDCTVLVISRVILVDHRPTAFLVDTIPVSVLRQEELGKDFRGSVLDILIQRNKQRLSHSLTEIVAESADKSIAQKLNLARGETLLKFSARLFAQDGQVLDYSFSYFAAGCFRFHVVRRIEL